MKGFEDRSGERVGNIYHFGNVYALDKNIGNAYNAHMALLPNKNDWGVITDGDTMFLVNDYGHQIAAAINANPDAGVITCVASRTGTGPQKFRGVVKHGMSNNPDILHHRQIALDLKDAHYVDVKTIGRYAGYLMAIQKGVWEKAGGFKVDSGIQSIDRDFGRRVTRIGKPILCMTGLYILHLYRLGWGGVRAVKHIS